MAISKFIFYKLLMMYFLLFLLFFCFCSSQVLQIEHPVIVNFYFRISLQPVDYSRKQTPN